MKRQYELPLTPAELDAERDELVSWLERQGVTVFERLEDGWTEYSDFVERDSFDFSDPDNTSLLSKIEADTGGNWGVMIGDGQYAPLADSLVVVGRFVDEDIEADSAVLDTVLDDLQPDDPPLANNQTIVAEHVLPDGRKLTVVDFEGRDDPVRLARVDKARREIGHVVGLDTRRRVLRRDTERIEADA